MDLGLIFVFILLMILAVYEVIKIGVRDGILEAEKKLENRQGGNNNEK